MTQESKILVIDSSSLVNYFDHYFFDRYYSKDVYKKLINFLFGKISSGEIIVIDKVFDEVSYLRGNNDFKVIKDTIKKYVVDTTSLIGSVQFLRDYYIKSENKRWCRDNNGNIDNNQIDRQMDLYLIAYCKENNNTVLLTDESISNDRKIVEKIPTICNKEKIKCINLPDSLFHHYKDELNFKLN